MTRGLVDDARGHLLIARERPGRGFRHVVTQRDLAGFIEIVPNWNTLASGLSAIVLSEGRDDADGFHKQGILHLCAWESDLVRDVAEWHFNAHSGVLDRLGVPCEVITEEDDARFVRCRFTEDTVRAYQLLHILMHELGHHHDRMTTRSKKDCARGEEFAESFAIAQEKLLWDRYVRVFPL